MPVDLDALAVQVGREMAAKRYARIENPSRILAGEDDDLPHVAHTICTARAMLAKLREMGLVVDGEKVRHRERGLVYTEVCRGFAQVSIHPIEDYTAVVIYRGTDGVFWVRNAVEFDDGRFEPVSAKGPGHD